MLSILLYIFNAENSIIPIEKRNELEFSIWIRSGIPAAP